MADKALEFPWMRSEALVHLRALSDVEAQQRWGQSGSPLDAAVHFLFDDTPGPAAALGYYLRTPAEVAALGAVVGSLDRLLEQHGIDLGDSDYVAKPEWTEVVQAAVQALQLLQENRVS